MTSIRLSRRQRSPKSRSSIITDNTTSFNQFEQIVTIHSEPSHREKKDQYTNLTEWYHSTSKSSKKKTGSIESSERSLPISLLQHSTENNKETLHLSNQNQQKIKSIYPQRIFIGPKIFDKECSCFITMRYRSDPTLPSLSYNSRRDEVIIFQIVNHGFSWIVFKSFVKMNDSFTFKSHRSENDRFHLKLEINGSLDTTISACCEYPYRHGGRIDDNNSSFWIENIQQYTICDKCRENIDLSSKSEIDEETQLEKDQSLEETTEEVKSSEVEHTSTIKSSIDPSSVPEKPISIPKVESFPHPPQVIVPPSPPSTVHESTISKVSVSTVQDKPSDDDSALFEYVNNAMQQALSKPPPNQTFSPRHIGNVENFTIFYINQNEGIDLSLLRPTVNLIRIINDPNTLGTLLAECRDEKVIVVMSLNQSESILRELEQHKCIQSIYLLSKETEFPSWMNSNDKILGIYPNIESIRDHLIKVLPDISFETISIEITSKDNISFIYSQLLKETILCQDDESDLKKDLLTYCRIHYFDNQEEINEFDKSFLDTQSIEWYTRYCFLTKILTRAFRTQEIDLLFKMRYFVQCIHKQIQSISIKESIVVYSILNIEQETIRKFQENINGLVLFRSFLPATLKRPENQNKRYIIFSIRLEPNCAANIEQLRSPNCKIDVLINIDTVFRIISLNEDENGVSTINLESLRHDDSYFEELTGSLRKEIKSTVVILQLIKLLLETHHYNEGDYLTELIYQDKSFEGDGTLLASLAAAHHLLGNVHVSNRDFQSARYQFFKSLRSFQLFLPFNHLMLSPSYNNIGNMFYQDDYHQSAIKFHEMALQCQLKASTPDMNSIATYSANIGAVYIDQNNYNEAIKHLKRAAIILEKMSIQQNSNKLIQIFQKISSCFWHIKEYKEALEYYKKTLDIQLQFTNPLPHPLSVTYYNLSTAYAKIGDYDQAVITAEKSIEYLKMISENHPELQENQAQLEIVKQKQWLKQALST